MIGVDVLDERSSPVICVQCFDKIRDDHLLQLRG